MPCPAPSQRNIRTLALAEVEARVPNASDVCDERVLTRTETWTRLRLRCGEILS